MRMDGILSDNHIAESVVTIARGACLWKVEQARPAEFDHQEGGRLRRLTKDRAVARSGQLGAGNRIPVGGATGGEVGG